MGNNGRDVEILITGHVQQVTEDAVCVQVHSMDDEDTPNCGNKWFPKSEISGTDPDDMEVQDDVEFYIPEWLAEKKELI